MVRTRAVFFDAGDTLIHRWALKAERFAWLCRQAGITLPADPTLVAAGAAAHERFFQDRRQHGDAWSNDWFVRWNQVGLAAVGLTDDLDALAVRIHSVAQSLPHTRVVPDDAIPLLEALRARGYRLAVVSNWDGDLVDYLRPTGLSGYFDAVLDSSVVGSWKPDGHIFEIACAATGVAPADALHVGDSPGADVAGAQAMGIRAVLLDPQDLFGDGFAGLAPFERILRLSDLLALLD